MNNGEDSLSRSSFEEESVKKSPATSPKMSDRQSPAARSRSRSRSRTSHKRYSRSRSPSPRRTRNSRSRSRTPRKRYYSRSRSRSPYSYKRRSRYRSRSRSPMSRRRRHMGDRENPRSSRCLGVFGLSLYTQERELREIFSRFGPVEDVQVVYDHQTGRSRGFAFIYMRNSEDAVEAKERAPGEEIDGRKIRVDFSITQRAHTPTPGIYLGKPTTSSSGYRSSRRSPSPYYGGGSSYRGYRRGYSRSRSRSRSYSPRRY